MSSPPLSFIGLNIGNTRTQIGRFIEGAPAAERKVDNADTRQVLAAVLEECRALGGEGRTVVVVASVNDRVATQIESGLSDTGKVDLYRIGEDLPVPIGTQLDPETLTGVDRLLNAAAAFAVMKQACVIVDAGTAVTVDFVDGEGTFHGGAIAPGARLQLRSMHGGTAALPELEFRAPDDEPFGRNTAQAMLQGVFHGIRGLVWKLVERYAEHYGAFPPVIATGGDAAALFEGDGLVDRIVPDLTLRGMAEAVRHSLATLDDEQSTHEHERG